MNAGPHNNMNLVETIAFYATLVLIHGQKEADDFLAKDVSPHLHDDIRACVNGQGILINSRGAEFFLEHYQVPLLPVQETPQW